MNHFTEDLSLATEFVKRPLNLQQRQKKKTQQMLHGGKVVVNDDKGTDVNTRSEPKLDCRVTKTCVP